jgi:hypothetical protein
VDRRPSLEAALAAFGIDVTVTPPGGPSFEMRAFWQTPATIEGPTGASLRRVEYQRRLVLPLADLRAIPRGTVVFAAPDVGLDPQEWRVDEVEKVADDHYRVSVVPA